MYWKYYTSGWKYIVRINQGWKNDIGKSDAAYVGLLCCDFGGTSAGNVCSDDFTWFTIFIRYNLEKEMIAKKVS